LTEKNDDGEESRRSSPESPDYTVPALISDTAVLIPESEIVVSLNDEKSLQAVRVVTSDKTKVIAVIPKSVLSPPLSAPSKIARKFIPKDIIGTLGVVESFDPLDSGTLHRIVLKGLWRIRVKKVIDEPTFQKAVFDKTMHDEMFEENSAPSEKGYSLMKKVHEQVDDFVKLIPTIPEEIISQLKQAKTPGVLADLCAISPTFSEEQRVILLETLDPLQRLEIISELFDEQLEALKKSLQVKPISECETCLELADKAFESAPQDGAKIAAQFLNHIVQEHTGELLGVLAEKYGPIFMAKRSLR